MRVLQLALRFDAPGGVETTVRELSRGLAEAGDHVEIYASDLYDEPRWERRDHYAPTVDGVAVRRFPVVKKLIPGLTMPMMPGLIDGLSGSGADVIDAHSHRYGHVLQAAAVSRRRGIPLVVSVHYHPADRGEPAWKAGLLRCQDHFFGMTAYRVARAVVVETENEARLLREFCPSDRIRIIPPGIDLAVWEDTRPPTALPELPPRFILYAGRIALNKGLPGLLRAYALIPPTHRLPLVLMGRDWGEQAMLERLAAELGVSAELRWLGHTDPRTYRAVFRRAAGLVLPSEWEAFGLVLLEAMVAGVPIVATAVGGVPEVLDQGRAGRLVPYGDAPGMAKALGEIADDEAGARARTEAGRQRVSQYTMGLSIQRHRALYREVAAA
ncbi:MAG: glycosyltransferase family 4 protein [Thermoplasmata archaeon]|nr:glycosyltransferase family 4 protein [Thermoplasmata archaeon]